jgi:hypothetical protein
MISNSPFPLDPLDRELLERALESVRTKVVCAGPEFESHAELEAMLRAELIEIARTNGVDDSEVLRRILPNEPSGMDWHSWLTDKPSATGLRLATFGPITEAINRPRFVRRTTAIAAP